MYHSTQGYVERNNKKMCCEKDWNLSNVIITFPRKAKVRRYKIYYLISPTTTNPIKKLC